MARIIDDPFAANVTGQDPESKRSAGVILVIFISYTNLKTYDLNQYDYTYTVDYIENTEFKTEQAIYDRVRRISGLYMDYFPRADANFVA